MKSSMVAALGSLAVLGQAQKASASPTVTTIAAVDVKADARPTVIPVPTTVVSQDGTTVTKERWPPVATANVNSKDGSWVCHATVIDRETRTLCKAPAPTPSESPRKHHGWVGPWDPPRKPHGSVRPHPETVIDPENACPRGYSCQPDYEHEHHDSVHNIGDDVEKCRKRCRRDDEQCHAGCDANQWYPPPDCHRHCGDGKCWDECSDWSFLPQPRPVCPMGSSCQKKRHKEWKTPSSRPTLPPAVSPVVPAPSDAPLVPTLVVPTPVIVSPPASMVKPHHKCPDGGHLCPEHQANGTILPPATVTTAGAGYAQPAAGVALFIAGVFGLLMA